MSQRRQDSAMRIVEALSGVEEELLERSVGTEGRKRDKKRSLGGWSRGVAIRYGALCAACLCVALFGAVWGGSLWRGAVGGRSGQGENENADGCVPESAAAVAENAGEGNYAPGGAADGQEESLPEMEIAWDGTVFAEPVWIDVAQLVEAASGRREDPLPDGKEQQAEQQTGLLEADAVGNAEGGTQENSLPIDGEMTNLCTEMTEKEKEEIKMYSEVNRFGEELSVLWEEACRESGLGEYVPSGLPEGYFPLEAEYGENAEEQSYLTLCWSDGEKALWLKLTETSLDPGKEYVWEPPVFDAGGDWTDRIPAPGEDGSIRFALLTGEGILAEYVGWLTEEEIRELFGQIPIRGSLKLPRE
ncbi:MAG: hypothetical protein NC541_15615 [bacterium]|nr:hypothetical protein [bacterium]